MIKLLRSIKVNKSGASAAEYALILAVVGGAIALAAVNLGATVGSTLNKTSNQLATPATATATVTPLT